MKFNDTNILDYFKENEKEFFNIIDELIQNETVQKMKNFRQHYETTCFDHCLMVSYYCYLICKKYEIGRAHV